MINYLALFIGGLLVGSFLNVIVYREIQEEDDTGAAHKKKLPPWVLGRSYCDKCKKSLAWYENIPLISFLILKGKCSHCHRKIPVTYPIFELVTAFEFVWIYWLIQRFTFFQSMEGMFSFWVLGFWLFVFSISIALTWIDLKSGILPDSLIAIGSIVAVMRLFFTGRWEFLLGGLALFSFFLFLFFVTQGKGIGFGDVKLGFFIGVVLGWWQWIVMSVFLAFLTGAVVGVILIVLRKKTIKSTIPFGPFLLGSMIVVKVLGDLIWQWYWPPY